MQNIAKYCKVKNKRQRDKTSFFIVSYMVEGGVVYNIHLFVCIIGDMGRVGVVSYIGDMGDIFLYRVSLKYGRHGRQKFFVGVSLFFMFHVKHCIIHLFAMFHVKHWSQSADGVGGGGRVEQSPPSVVKCPSRF